ncbi:MAG: glycerate kinase [Sedimentisphaerales bacterium]|nr:glycerate kinase [Sedimentisphaerales bacterium]
MAASEACKIVSAAIKSECPEAHIVLKPMADGGEGTAKAMITAREGKWVPKKVMGPLPEIEAEAGFAWFEKQKEAVVEMATASGIELLRKEQLNPLKTTTYGTGQLIKAASEYGAEKILLAVGGSATVDCGVGSAMALGWNFLDSSNEPVSYGGQKLINVKKIIKPTGLRLPVIEVLCDVENPLCGKSGAAKIFGPQKGATPEMVEQLEKGLFHIAELVKSETGVDIKDLPGAGSAGGLSAGAVAFMNAKLVSGVDTIIKEIELKKDMIDADWIITGEGFFDHQSLKGKVVSGIINTAKDTNAAIAVIAGGVSLSEKKYKKYGITTAIACRKNQMTLEYAITNCKELLYTTAQEFAKKNL